MSFRQDRTNPSTAVSNWKGRSETPKGWPSTAVSTWQNGGLFGAGGPDFSGGARSNPGDGYNYQTYTASGTVTCESGGEVDLILAGGGGGRNYNLTWPARNWMGGGGSSGVVYATGVTVDAGTYSLNIGAGATTQAQGGNSNVNLIGGWYIYAGGGGQGGTGNSGCGGGQPGRALSAASPYVACVGAGGGGGVWSGICGGAGGPGGPTTTSGTGGGGGTWSTLTSGDGTSSGTYAGAGGGGGGATANSNVFDAGAGHTWVDGVVYGQGGNGGGTSTVPQGGYGAGNGSSDVTMVAGNGVFIVRWPE